MRLSPSRRWLLPALIVLLWVGLAASWSWGLGRLGLLGFLLLSGAVFAGAFVPGLGFFGPVMVGGDRGVARVALTFDDGPDPRWTPQILDILAVAGARATFFVIGDRVAAAPDLARRIVADGHQLGHHGQSHRWSLMFRRRRLLEDFDRGSDAIAAVVGHPRFHRPPVGVVAPEVMDLVASREVRLAAWTVRPYDTRVKDPDALRKKIASKVLPGSIVLMHDGALEPGHRPAAVDALAGILEDLRARGLGSVTLAELVDEPAYFEGAPVRHRPRWSKLPLLVLTSLLLLLGVGLGSALAAPPPSLPPELQAAAEQLAANKTVSSRFTQTKSSILFAEDMVQTGTLLLRRADGRLVWRYDDGPAVLMAGGRFYPAGVGVEEAGEEAAAGVSLPGGGTMIDLMEAMFSLKADALAAAFAATTKAPDRFELIPRDPGAKALFARVELEVGGAPLALRRVIMDEATGDRTTLIFTDVAIDTPLPPGAFQTPAERSAAK